MTQKPSKPETCGSRKFSAAGRTLIPTSWRSSGRQASKIWTLLFLLAVSGCVSLPGFAGRSAVPPQNNPFFVPSNQEEVVWERTVDVIHDYFEIARENRLDGVIESAPKVGSGLLEPWHKDSVGFGNKLESSLQSIRRRAFVHITPTEGGYLIGVEVFKEMEDLPGTASNSAGAATFNEAKPLQRDLTLVVGQSTPSGWIPLGRDLSLEDQMLVKLQAAFAR